MGAIKQWREQHTEATLVLDAGNIADDPEHGRVVWDAVVAAKYDAVSIGLSEQRWLPKYLSMVAHSGIPILGQSTEPSAGAPAGEGTTLSRDFIIKSVGVYRVGVTSLGAEKTPPAERVQHVTSILRDLRRQCDAVVLLTHRPLEQERQALEGEWRGLVDLAIGTTGSEGIAEPVPAGGGQILPGALNGREVGMAGISPAGPKGSGRVDVAFRRLVLTGATPADPTVQASVQGFYAERQQREQARAALQKGMPVYAGSRECIECHPSAYRAWSESAHSRSLKTLVDDKKAVPECLQCHSEQFRQTAKVDLKGEAQGVECTSCHGTKVAAHLAVPRIGNVDRGGLAACAPCHTAERSPGFQQEHAWAIIKH